MTPNGMGHSTEPPDKPRTAAEYATNRTLRPGYWTQTLFGDGGCHSVVSLFNNVSSSLRNDAR